MAVWFWLAMTLGFGAERASIPIEELVGVDPSLDKEMLGNTRYGVYAHGHSFVGQLALGVSKAKRSKGAGYAVRSTIDMGLGQNQLDIREIAYVSRGFAMVESEGRVLERDGEDPMVPLESKHAYRDGVGWVIEMRSAERTTLDRVTAPEPNRAGMWAMYLLARALSGEAAGDYEMYGVLPTRGDPAHAQYKLQLRLGEPGTHRLREQEYAAQLVEISAENGWVFSLVVADGKVLEMWSNDYPMTFAICATVEECSQDLGKGLDDGPMAVGPMDVMRVFYSVLAGELDSSALDEVVDWDAVAKTIQRGKDEPLDVEAVARSTKEVFSSEERMDPERIDATLLLLEVTVDGNHALVGVPNEEGRFRLKKVNERWKIIQFPE
jgi:hypothetical protein